MASSNNTIFYNDLYIKLFLYINSPHEKTVIDFMVNQLCILAGIMRTDTFYVIGRRRFPAEF